jgi:hypothetical protein
MALLLSNVPAAVVPCVGWGVRPSCFLGQSLRYVATRPGHKPSGRRESRGVSVDPEHRHVWADPHALQRHKVRGEPQEEGFTALGLCGEPSLVTIKYLLTRRPQMSGSAGVCQRRETRLPALRHGHLHTAGLWSAAHLVDAGRPCPSFIRCSNRMHSVARRCSHVQTPVGSRTAPAT